jgi:uncharacterized protein
MSHEGIETMSLEMPLLEILACPIDKGGLLYFRDEGIEGVLYNPRLRRLYRVVDGRPVMLANRAEAAPEAEHHRLLARAQAGHAAGTGGLVPWSAGPDCHDCGTLVTDVTTS